MSVADAICAIGQNDNLKLRNGALVYLYHEHNYKPAKLATMCSLARTTIANYVRKFWNLLSWAKEQFEKVHKVVQRKIKTTTKYLCYIMQIKTEYGDYWTKVGQTTQDPEKRAEQICKKGCKIADYEQVKVIKIIECPDETSMNNMEDCLRIGMTSIYPEAFEKNDRLLAWEDNYPKQILENNFVKMGLQEFSVTV